VCATIRDATRVEVNNTACLGRRPRSSVFRELSFCKFVIAVESDKYLPEICVGDLCHDHIVFITEIVYCVAAGNDLWDACRRIAARESQSFDRGGEELREKVPCSAIYNAVGSKITTRLQGKKRSFVFYGRTTLYRVAFYVCVQYDYG